MNRKLIALLVAAAVLRLWIVFTAAGVNSDAFKYALTARRIAEQGVVAGLRGDYFWPYYPVNRQLVFYPLTGSIVMRAVGDEILALRLVSALAGVGLVWLGFVLARDLFSNEAIALLSAAILAFHSEFARASAAVYREVPMAFLVVLALVLALRAMRAERWWPAWAAGAGLTLFAAFMTRPDGAVAAVVVGLIALLARGRAPLRRRVAICAAMAVAFLALQAPYMLWLRRETGRWMVTQWQVTKTMTEAESAGRFLLGKGRAP